MEACHRDPLNPWPHRALGDLLVQGGDLMEEGLALLARTKELEAREPEEARGGSAPETG
jgi:hypothetical protein